MGFQIVSKKKTSELPARRVVNSKNIVKGNILYTDESGQEAIFKYVENNKGILKDVELPINSRELYLVGAKWCYCLDKLNAVSKGDLVVYIPTDPFDKHIFNCYKFKPGSTILAEIFNDKAYVVSKPEFRKKNVQGNKSK